MERLAECAILPAGPGDAPDLGEVHVRAWRETYPGLLPEAYLARMDARLHARRWRLQLTRAHPADVALVAEGPDGVIGYCGGVCPEGAPLHEVHTLYLLRRAQGQGLGRRLLAATARVGAARGAGALRLWVLGGNVRARGFYAHLGGRPAGERPVSGWGGDLRETAFVWDDIAALAAGG